MSWDAPCRNSAELTIYMEAQRPDPADDPANERGDDYVRRPQETKCEAIIKAEAERFDAVLACIASMETIFRKSGQI